MTGQIFGDVYFKENDKPILIDRIFALPKSYSILAENGWTTKIKSFYLLGFLLFLNASPGEIPHLF
jgi:hypothetical protein